jgi:Ca2+-binding RTX toxin-like protein
VPRATITRVVIELKDGDDALNHLLGADLPITMTVDGGPGDDFLRGGPMADIIRGGDGGDSINGAGGADDISAGAGFDSVSLFGLGGITVSLDDVANDGQFAGAEGANVHSNVEDLGGTDGDDVLIGSAAANALFGGLANARSTGAAAGTPTNSAPATTPRSRRTGSASASSAVPAVTPSPRTTSTSSQTARA